MIDANAQTVFECSWEVCNKVGGIYTVVTSKARYMMKYYEEYYLVGPYFKNKTNIMFEEQEAPTELKEIFYELSGKNGIICHYGKWLIEGEPSVILIDFESIKNQTNRIKKELWEHFQIDSINARWDFEEPMLWGYAIGLLIDKFEKRTKKKDIVVHGHEWLSGFGLLYLKLNNKNIKTVFTTHATMLGRSIASSGRDLYSELEYINPYEEAKKINVLEKFTTEKACAINSDIFTTVSEITGKEAEYLLGRKPDVLTLNGLDLDKFPTIEETSLMHIENRKELRKYLTYHFYPHYEFDLEHNLMFCISGRPEFKNKGLDIFIKALGKLNRELKENPIRKRTVTAFIWMIYDGTKSKQTLIENKEHFTHIQHTIERNSQKILNTFMYDFLENKNYLKRDLISKRLRMELNKDILLFKRKGNPLVCSKNINENRNIIVQTLLNEGLNNSESNPVKIVFYPCFLDGNDSLLNLKIYDAISGCHLAVFPSLYEPWGYTPLESSALGISTVTTNLAGFGKFIETKIQKQHPGMFVIKRYKKSDEEATEELFQIMKSYSKLRHSERVHNKANAKELSYFADWKFLIKNYIEAYNLAIKK